MELSVLVWPRASSGVQDYNPAMALKLFLHSALWKLGIQVHS